MSLYYYKKKSNLQTALLLLTVKFRLLSNGKTDKLPDEIIEPIQRCPVATTIASTYVKT